MNSEVNLFNQVEKELTRKRPGSGQPISTKKSPLPLRKPGVSGTQKQIIKEPEQQLKPRQLSSNSQKTSQTQQLPMIKNPPQQQKPQIQIDKKIIMMKQESATTSARGTLTGEHSQRNSSNQNLSTADTSTKQFNWIDDQLTSRRDSSLNKKRMSSKEKQTTTTQTQKSKLQDNHKNSHPPLYQPKCCIDFTMTAGKNDLTKMLDSIKGEIKQIAEEQSHQNGVFLNMSEIKEMPDDGCSSIGQSTVYQFKK
ncbi:unnamed protein product (macronuclear) [Paramecium tetraurelia]|uniref:Uncharacterized protein n=1 Tax=Paramecium tetraurelia TaxID=5888 RepID=A0CSL7_PARTE|nr:uncharacterized protein GSPATT00010056001 [Paramecium tetraurelia]CAK73784.1 unnamed protein product [Paramecium tetraurelia]|eukprot:XP_001441181.1 hypothetical protein (macronuclear) [Paramecium tetraurelia strain d4-2]